MIRRRRSVETKVDRDRWLVSYADFITLLFGFFVVMYSVSQVNETAYQELARTLGTTFNARDWAPDDVSAASTSSLVTPQELAEQIGKVLATMIDADQVQVTATEQWVEVSVDAGLLFASGSAQPSVEATEVFSDLADLLAPYQNAIEVAGHTDDRPIANAEFANNWELSAARATAVVNLLYQQGVEPHRLAATGYGEFRPVADNITEEGRAANRRVALVVAAYQAERPVMQAESVPAVLTAPPAAATDSESAAAAQSAESTAGDQAQSQADELLRPIVREDGSLLFTTDPEKRRQHDDAAHDRGNSRNGTDADKR